MTTPSSSPISRVSFGQRLCANVLGACSMALVTLPVCSADTSASAASALKTLLGTAGPIEALGASPLNAAAPSMIAMSSGQDPAPLHESTHAVTVQRGETLDRVIKRTLPGLPLHQDFLRKAFVSLNPQAFPSGSPNFLRAGSTLQVPNTAMLRQMLISQHPSAAALFQNEASTSGNGISSASDKRHWVRFP